MKAPHTDVELELYKRIDEVIFYEWDPLYVSSFPSARDEYSPYLPNIFKLLIENATVDEIAAYLDDVSMREMGNHENKDHSHKIAILLRNWKLFINRIYSQ